MHSHSSLPFAQKASSVRTCFASLCWLALCAPGCGSPCLEEDCTPYLVLRGSISTPVFPPGDALVTVDVDGKTTECLTTIPADGVPTDDVTVCDNIRVWYKRATSCTQSEQNDNLTLHCDASGEWQQNIRIDGKPTDVSLRETLDNGSVVDETFRAKYEASDPYRVNCSECKNAEETFSLN